MRATENFLRLVWPDAGEKAIVTIKDGEPRHYWFKPEQIHEAAELVEELTNEGKDVYMALAGFEGHRRKAEQAVALKTLYLDIDCGNDKDYPTQTEANESLGNFLSSSGLPPPLVISSGYGLHAYWPLDKDVDRNEWLWLAESLKQLCKTHGLKTDEKCTADAARILRPIGSQNFKNGTPRRVSALAAGNICVTSDIKEILSKQTNIFQTLAQNQASTTPTTTGWNTTYPLADFDEILPRCATLRYVNERQDEIREPLWYAALGLANYCKDGLAVAHRISKNHPEYDPDHTERKQSHWNLSVSGPPTCDTFRQCPGTRCAGCPERITTPLFLGIPNNVRPTHVLQPAGNIGPRFTDPWIKVTANGMTVRVQGKPDGSGNFPPPEWIKIADYGIQPLLNLRLTDQNGVATNYIWMETHDENFNPLQSFVIPAVSVNNSALFAADCARNGVINEHETSTGAFRTFAKVMRTWVNKLMKDQGDVITFRSFGWVGPDGAPNKDSFLLGSKLYTKDEVRDTPTLPSLEGYQQDMVPHGTLAEWTKAMDGYNTPGMESYMFATWTAWAAPLMSFTNSGNLVFSLVGDTGVGKSSMQKAIISTYGRYDSKILLDQHDSTINSVNGGMGYLNSLPYCREEASEKEAEEISSWVLTMTQGRERGRMTQSLNIAHIKTWSTVAVISSNISIREIVTNTRKDNAARLARVWEQNVILPIPQDQASQIFGPLRRNYGHAGPIYIQYLVSHYEEVRQLVQDTEEKLMRKLQASGSDRFFVSLLAACFVGASIAIGLGLINHDLKRGREFAIKQYKRLRQDAKDEQSNAEQMLARMIQDLQPTTLVVEYDNPKNATSVFDSNNNVIRAPSANAVIQARYAKDTGSFYVSTSAIRKWYVDNHVNFQQSMKELQNTGVAVSLDDKVVLTKASRFSDNKQTRCCVFNLASSSELTYAAEQT